MAKKNIKISKTTLLCVAWGGGFHVHDMGSKKCLSDFGRLMARRGPHVGPVGATLGLSTPPELIRID
ncbi:unnamed protein product [Dovyalis caffra]|uniref:Uncharacterized protein n=1 Tax=Dovyalis caffra TaxID=77055 RepID=A0AAV1RCL5_9ROSI|nr:unnamed protein product [Dovyalis caffra]